MASKTFLSKLGLLLSTLCLGYCNSGNSQVYLESQNEVRCIDKEFDTKVRRMINFSVPTIDVDSLRNFQEEVYIFDAREQSEYEVSHIPNAQLVGYNTFVINAIPDDIPKDAKIVVYCSIGYRSEKIAKQLMQAGYTNVNNLFGSIFEWVNRGYPIVNAGERPTTDIHTYNRNWSRWVLNDTIQKVW